MSHYGRIIPVTYRRFPSLPPLTAPMSLFQPSSLLYCLGTAEKSGSVEFPPSPQQCVDDDTTASTMSLILLNCRDSDIWNAKTWLGCIDNMNALLRGKSHPSMAIRVLFLWSLPLYRFPLHHLCWSKRCGEWAEENHIDKSSIYVTYDNNQIYNDLGIVKKRQYAIIINGRTRDSHQILFCSHGRYDPKKHDTQLYNKIISIAPHTTTQTQAARA